MRLRRLRTKIVLSFCVLMVAGGVVTTTVVGHQLSGSLVAEAGRQGSAVATALAARLGPMLDAGDTAAAQLMLDEAAHEHAGLRYVQLAGGPTDGVAGRSHTGALLPWSKDKVTDVSAPVGRHGTLHVGVSLAAAHAATVAVVRNVLLITAMAMLAGIFGIVFLAGLITRPIGALMQAAARIGRADFDSTAPVDGHDEVAQLGRTFNEMAEQLRARMAESERLHRYFARVLDQLPLGVLVCGRDRRPQYANRVLRDGDARGLPCLGRDASDTACSDCPALGTGAAHGLLHRTHTTPGGRVLELTHAPFAGEDDHDAVVVTAVDVTEQQQLAARLHRAERLAVAGEIAAGVVHAVNNPLDGVRRALDLAGRDLADHRRVTDMLALATEGVERIAQITRTLLDLARADEVSASSPVSINESVEQAARFMALNAQGRGVTVHLDLAPAVPAVMVEPRGLNDVIVNLLLNAIDATPAGGRIDVRTGRRDNGTVELVVADTGVGIAAGQLETIFEPFFTTKEVGRGTGLGLAVVRRFVEAHGGDITVDSELGKGATFHICLKAAAFV